MTRCTIISSVNGVNTPNVDAVAACLATIPDGDEFTISMRHVIGELCVQQCDSGTVASWMGVPFSIYVGDGDSRFGLQTNGTTTLTC